MMRELDTILETGAQEEIYLNREDNYTNHPPPLSDNCPRCRPRHCPKCQGLLEFRHAGSFPFARRQALICVPCDVAWLWFEPPCI